MQQEQKQKLSSWTLEPGQPGSRRTGRRLGLERACRRIGGSVTAAVVPQLPSASLLRVLCSFSLRWRTMRLMAAPALVT